MGFNWIYRLIWENWQDRVSYRYLIDALIGLRKCSFISSFLIFFYHEGVLSFFNASLHILRWLYGVFSYVNMTNYIERFSTVLHMAAIEESPKGKPDVWTTKLHRPQGPSLSFAGTKCDSKDTATLMPFPHHWYRHITRVPNDSLAVSGHWECMCSDPLTGSFSMPSWMLNSTEKVAW